MNARGRKRAPQPATPAPDARPAESSPWLKRAPLLAAAVAALTWAPSLAGGFLYDDGSIILRNPFIRDLGALGTILRYEPARPLLGLTWALNYAAAGVEPWPYHLVNVAVHAANAALLPSLFRWLAERAGWARPRAAALLGACLFAATPMAAETVAYVASRSSALQALFALACLRVALPALERRSPARLALAMALFLLALVTKEEAAAVPLLLLLLDDLFVAGPRLERLRGRAAVHACFLAVLPLGLVARRLATGYWLPEPAVPRDSYLLTQIAAFPGYFLRALVPFDPALYRYVLPASWPPDAATTAWIVGAVALVACAVAVRRSQPQWSFAVLGLAAGLLPSSSLVALQEMVVDHRAYLGSIGVAFALGGFVMRAGGVRLGVVVVALCAARSVHYEWVLADPVRAWEDAVRRSPGAPDALCALGEAYRARGDARAEAAFLEATRLNPGNYRYWANLGMYYTQERRLDVAVPALRAAVRAKPGDASVRDYLGQVLWTLNLRDEAVQEFEAAIAAEPGFAQAYLDLAAVRLELGEPARAQELLQRLGRVPTTPQQAARAQQLHDRMR